MMTRSARTIVLIQSASHTGTKPSICGGGGVGAVVAGISCSLQSGGGGTLQKPRLVRQQAVQEETADLSSSPPRLSVRFLPTIPSAADSSVILDDDASMHHHECVVVTTVVAAPAASPAETAVTTVALVATTPAVQTTPFYAILQSGSTTLTTLSSPKSIRKQPP